MEKVNNKITAKINVKDNLIGIMRVENKDYISLTDLARYKNESNPGDVIIKWMSNKSSFDFYCLWEELYNEDWRDRASYRGDSWYGYVKNDNINLVEDEKNLEKFIKQWC